MKSVMKKNLPLVHFFNFVCLFYYHSYYYFSIYIVLNIYFSVWYITVIISCMGNKRLCPENINFKVMRCFQISITMLAFVCM